MRYVDLTFLVASSLATGLSPARLHIPMPCIPVSFKLAAPCYLIASLAPGNLHLKKANFDVSVYGVPPRRLSARIDGATVEALQANKQYVILKRGSNNEKNGKICTAL